MKKTIFLSCLLFSLFSCQNKSTEPYFKVGYNYVQQTPDSLRTTEQKELIDKITKVVYQNVSVKNNKVSFNLNEKEFVDKGIPVEYYDLVQKDMVNINKFIKENNITNFDSILKESYNKL